MSVATGLALGIITLMIGLAVRADRLLAVGHDQLPMNFAPNGTVLWRAPRRVALGFMPGLAVVVFLSFALFAPDAAAALVAALPLLAGQLFYHRLIARSL